MTLKINAFFYKMKLIDKNHTNLRQIKNWAILYTKMNKFSSILILFCWVYVVYFFKLDDILRHHFIYKESIRIQFLIFI